VSRPHDGQRIVRVGCLPNIVGLVVGRHDVTLVEPDAEIDETAGERAEWPLRVVPPGRRPPARRAPHRDVGVGGHVTRIVLIADKACQRADLARTPGMFAVDTLDGRRIE
jgi:hypothetical protein